MKRENKYKKEIRVLVFQAEGRQALPVCKGFYEIGCHVTAYCSSKLATGYLTRYADEKILFYGQKNEFFQHGIELIKTKQFDLVIPLSDDGATLLSKHKQELEEYTKIAVNYFDTLVLATNKLNTMKLCEDLEIPAPISFTSEAFADTYKAKNIKYPVVIKPQTGVGSIGFNIIDTELKLQEYLKQYSGQFGPLLIQEYVNQGNYPQYRADFYRDRNGVYRAATVGKVTRWYPLDGGSGIFAYTVHDDFIIQMCEKLLDKMNWRGYANIDIVWDAVEDLPKIIEVNCRTGATIKLDYLAGINVSQLILEDELGIGDTEFLNYPDDIKMSCLLPDLLWLVKSPNRFTANPSWFKRSGIKDAIFEWDDPKPTFGFLCTSVLGYKESMKKRKRIN